MIDAEIRRAIEIEAEAAEDTAVYNLDLIRKLAKRTGRLENDNVAQAKHIELLTRLVERMGCDLFWYGYAGVEDHDYTVAGQRQYDAAMHEAEGAPPDAGMLEAVQ